MAVQYEIKSQLAKLLATEDLIVEHKHVETAQFNVQTRVLILPLWEKASNSVYDMLVAHEVGHALFTPNEDYREKVKIPFDFINVCEDARIEKLMKRKYAGLPKTFYYGYSDLHDEDFFNVLDVDFDKFNLADKANLYFKIGNFIDVTFTPKEQEIVDEIANTETFDEVLAVSEKLYNYCKENMEEQKKQVQDLDLHKVPQVGQPESPELSDNVDDSSQEEVEKKVEQTPTEPQNDFGSDESGDMVTLEEEQTDSPYDPNSAEPQVATAEELERGLKDLIASHDGRENIYVELPDVKLDKVIESNKEVHEVIENHFIQEWNRIKLDREKNGYSCVSNPFEEIDSEFIDFKKSARKEVNYLVKEFECKKAASAYARAAIARTGVLNTSKLHTYKFNEDLFKKVTILPDGKNHGLIFILDWSGSMQYILQDTLKQLYNLIWFCRKVNIPFDVYAFSNEYKRQDGWGYSHNYDDVAYEKKENIVAIDSCFSLMNFFTSDAKGKDLDKQMLNIWRVASLFRTWGHISYPRRLALSGTPLNESLICLRQILPEFQKKHNLEKVQCIVLTDGEAAHLAHHVKVERSWEDEPYIGSRNILPEATFIRDRKLGSNYKIGYKFTDFTDSILQNLQDLFPTVNFIGIRVISPRGALSFARHFTTDETKLNVIEKDWKKSKCYNIQDSSYDAYFVLSSANLNDNAEFEVKEDATKSQIKSAFVRSLKTKKLNKKVLGEFISLVV